MANDDCEEYSELQLTPDDIIEEAESAKLDILPKKSKPRYKKTYNEFEKWRATHKINSYMSVRDEAVEVKSVTEKPPPVFAEVHKWFHSVDEDKRSGRIAPKELQTAFEVFQNRHFSDNVCKFIVRLFDLDKRGGLDLKEFEQLYYYVKQWVNAFHAHDYQRTGYLDEREFAAALEDLDVKFTPDFVRYLMKRSDPTKDKIALDQFVMTCIQIQRYTEEFKQRDASFSGEINLKYEDFLEMILKCM